MFTEQSLAQISRLLLFFSQKVPHYKINLCSWQDFQKVPLSNKAIIQKFLAQHHLHKPFNITATSGSTATRMLIAHSYEAYQAHLDRLVQLYRSVGVKKGMVILNLCSYELNSGGRLMEKAFNALGAGVIPLGPITSREKVKEAKDLIHKIRPQWINAYTNQLYDLFSLLGQDHSIRYCLVNGEPLWPTYKERIEKMGGVYLHNHYGAMEISGLAVAIQPSDEYMKVFYDGLLLEILQETGEVSVTGKGSLLITDLHNYCMPVIRYAVGDQVELISRNNCLWIKVLGRNEDSILINGSVIWKKNLIRAVHDYVEHPNFFFIVNKNAVTYSQQLIINVKPPFIKDIQGLSLTLEKKLGLKGKVTMRQHMGRLPRTSSGKIKYFLSSVDKVN